LGKAATGSGLLDINQLQADSKENKSIYETGEELLNEV
jgi:hypothetical protein